MATSVFSPNSRGKNYFRSFSLLALALGLAGCPGDDDGPPPGGAEVELGIGAVEFEPLIGDGPEVVLEAGPQGGHHFIVNCRIRGFLPGDPTMPGLVGNPSTRFSAFQIDGTQIDLMFPPYRLGYAEQPDGFYHLPSGRILQVDDELVDDLYGESIRIEVEVRDAREAAATDERTIFVVMPDPNAPDGGVSPFDAGPDGGPADAGVDASP